jgi:hypothetical protein
MIITILLLPLGHISFTFSRTLYKGDSGAITKVVDVLLPLGRK